jgi:hypothetical protein
MNYQVGDKVIVSHYDQTCGLISSTISRVVDRHGHFPESEGKVYFVNDMGWFSEKRLNDCRNEAIKQKQQLEDMLNNTK